MSCISTSATNSAKEYQTALYLAVDKRKLIIQNGKTPMTLPLADFTLLLSTTDEYGLLQPCRDRMKLLLRFDFYSEPNSSKCCGTAARRCDGSSMRWSSPKFPNEQRELPDWR